MNQLRNMGEGKENVVACAFGPGIALEMMILKRNSNESRDWQTLSNGHAAENHFGVESHHATVNGNGTEGSLLPANGNGLEDQPTAASGLLVPDLD